MINKDNAITWQAYLLELQLRYASWTRIGQTSTKDGLDDATEIMQRRYPGNYTVDEKYDPVRGTFSLYLRFNDPRDETIFILKHS